MRRAKQEEKRARKTEREESGVTGPEMGEAQTVVAPSGLWEWFSPSRTRTITTAVGTRPEGSEPYDWVLLTETPPDGPRPDRRARRPPDADDRCGKRPAAIVRPPPARRVWLRLSSLAGADDRDEPSRP